MYFQQLLTSVRVLLALSVLTGLVYPLFLTGVAQVFFCEKANGSLIYVGGQPVGSRLVGQPFESPSFFWGRLSATGPTAYNGAASSGSNLGPLNPALRQSVQARIDALRQAAPENRDPVPIDLVTASGSGLDPHITPAAAHHQLNRVAKARNWRPANVEQLVRENTEERFLGLLGEPRVNVLRLNLALEQVTTRE